MNNEELKALHDNECLDCRTIREWRANDERDEDRWTGADDLEMFLGGLVALFVLFVIAWLIRFGESTPWEGLQ